MNSKQRLRARGILILITAAAGVLAVTLYWIQIAKGGSYAAKANTQYARPGHTVFDRGPVFFSSRDGAKVSAATVASGYTIYMNPTLVTDREGTYQALSQYMDLDRAEFLRRAQREGDLYEELAERVNTEKATSITTLGLAGIGSQKETWRFYPSGSLSAHTLGLIGESPDGSIEGRYGIERQYEHVLKRTGASGDTNIFAELFAGLRDSVFGGTEDKEGDIITTIEPTAAAFVESVLKKTSETWSPDEIGAIVMDPETGEIIAMSSLPTFDGRNLVGIKDVSVFSNPLVEHVYEMGSIMKPLTMAIALDSDAVTPTSTYEDTGTMELDDKKISNYDGKARGKVGMQEILSQSLNVGAATIALKTGAEKFAAYLESFEFGLKTGIDQPNEANGLLDNLKKGGDIEIATAAYGQGIALSPIAMTRALAVLANGGYVSHPHVVKKIEYADGTSEEIKPEKTGPVLKKETVDEVTRMLVKVVDEALKGGAIKMEKYSVAAKTGTAQIPDPVGGGYYKDRYLHSFFGYFPAYNPRFLVFLYQIHPKGAQFASDTLTQPFNDISTFLINYYNVPPDR